MRNVAVCGAVLDIVVSFAFIFTISICYKLFCKGLQDWHEDV
jgi:hypothetical protein